MKLLYLSTWDFTNEKSDGVCKKIYSQISVFEKNGCEVDLIYIKNGKILYREEGNTREIGTVGSIKKTPAYIKMYGELKNKKYDWVYNRYGMMDTFYYRVLKRLHKNGARILIEIPTYPYAGEIPEGILYRLMFWWDEIYLKRLKRIVDRIVTYSQDEKIFDIQTIHIMNGVEVNSIKPVCREKGIDDTIDLLIVALMQPYHGYERLLYGLKKYYEEGGTRKILCHFVGDGPERAAYEKIVSDCGLEDHTRFYGMKGGEELEHIYERADIGVCSLGCYKKGIYWSSELKSREYLAKGIPIIAGIEIDIFSVIDNNYFLQFPNDESLIAINQITKFYDKVYQQDYQSVAENIREMASKYIDVKAAIKLVCDYIS